MVRIKSLGRLFSKTKKEKSLGLQFSKTKQKKKKVYRPLRTEQDPPATQMIFHDERFSDKGLKDFMNLHKRDVSYAVVAIMGPQSSGKSTLLNRLWQTNFTEMEDGSSKRERTTKGIWISKARNMDLLTLVMDVEGTDGRERGEDGTAFEKRTTLFSLVVADILIINMWYNDIGRVNAANMPLLRTIFEEMVQILGSHLRKTTLHIVIRDRKKGGGDLKTSLCDDVQKIWELVPKTEDFKNRPLSEFFNVEVDALPNYEYERTNFEEEVVQLREKIKGSIRIAAGDRRGVVPTSAFSLNAKRLWETIQQNRNLDLPTHKKMVATVRCEEIAMDKLSSFESDGGWLELKAAAKTRFVSGLGARISSILNRYLTEYDSETEYFEEEVRNAKRQNLESNALALVHPAYMDTLDHAHKEALTTFETELDEHLSGGGGYVESVGTCQEKCEREFDQRCSDAAILIEQARWDASNVREALVRDMKKHARYVRTADVLPQLLERRRAQLGNKVNRELNRIFHRIHEEGISWPSIKSFVKRESESAASAFCSEVAAFELNQPTLKQHCHRLKQHATNLVVTKFKEQNDYVLDRIKERYFLSLARDEEEPFRECLKLLSTMAVIRLDDSSTDDTVESLLLSALMNGEDEVSGNDPLALDAWEEVRPPEMTLITPRQCKDIWVQFKQDIESTHNQIQSAENENASYIEQPGNSENSEETESGWLPYLCRFGTWLLGVTNFVSLLRRWDFQSAIPLFSKLLGDAIDLIEDCPLEIKEMVECGWEKTKNGWRRMKRNYHRFLRKLKGILQRFYNFMTTKFTMESAVPVS